jgi:hypothetical protein
MGRKPKAGDSKAGKLLRKHIIAQSPDDLFFAEILFGRASAQRSTYGVIKRRVGAMAADTVARTRLAKLQNIFV